MKTRPTKEGLYYTGIMLCIFTAGIMRGVNLLFIIAGMMLGPLIFNRWLARAVMRNVRLRRTLPDEIYADEPFPVKIELETASKYRFGGLCVESPCEPAEVTLQKIQENSPKRGLTVRTVQYSAVFRKRGEYSLAPIRLWTDYPFGLFSCRKEESPATTVLVYPKLTELPPNWRRRAQEQANLADAVTELRTHHTGEFFGLRDWHSGDSLRMIHWRSSAKHGTPIVRQWEQTSLVHVWIFADFGPAKDEAAFEKSVSLTASIMHELCGRSAVAAITVKLFGKENRFLEGSANHLFYRDVLAELARIEMRPGPWPGDVSLEEEMRQCPAGTEVVLVRSS